MRKLLYGLLLIASILAGMYACMDLLWGSMCGNEIVEELSSPNKNFKAVIFIRDCGATTGYSTQLSIIGNSANLDDEGGNVLIMSDKTRYGLTSENGGAKVKATWTSDSTMTIYLDKRTEVMEHEDEDEISGIKISYEQIAE
jgi:hypothetical protein